MRQLYKQILFFTFINISFLSAQSFKWESYNLRNVNVNSEIVSFDGSNVLKVERNLEALPFDLERLEATVDEPTYVRIEGLELRNGTIEFDFYSSIQNPTPFEGSQGFIGLAFRINSDNSAYESIYLRPKVGRSKDQDRRNKTVQYYAYPNFKFDVLRKSFGGKYETTAPIDINEWVHYRLVIIENQAELFINDSKYSTFIVDQLLSNSNSGTIGLWVDIGTVGYFKNLKIISN